MSDYPTAWVCPECGHFGWVKEDVCPITKKKIDWRIRK